MLLKHKQQIDIEIENNFHIFFFFLNSVSSQCARGKLSISRKPEDHPNVFLMW